MLQTKTQSIIAATHLTVSQYANKKQVSRAAIYKHIADGSIVPDLVGMEQLQMIDWSIYDTHTFAEPKWSEKKMREKIMKEGKEE